MPWAVKFMALYPGLAGVVVLVLGGAARGIGRSIALIALGVLPFLVLAGAPEGQALAMPMGHGLLASLGSPSMTAWFLTSLAGFVGVFVGSRARCFRPASMAAAVIGFVGGIVYLIALVLPVLPSELGTIELLAPFRLLNERGMEVFGAAWLAGIGFMIPAALLCILNLGQRADPARLARTAFTLLVVGCSLAGAIAFIQPVSQLGEVAEPLRGIVLGAVITMTGKLVCWMLGLLLLVPVGLTDLVINLSRGKSAPHAATPGSEGPFPQG